MKKLKIILMLSLLFSFPLQQQAEAQDAKIILSKSRMGTGVAVFDDGNYRIVGSIGQPIRQNPGQLTRGQLWYLGVQIITTEAAQKENGIPTEFSLDQNYPNPFNPTTTIQFTLPEASRVTLKLFDILGRELVTLVDKEMETGVHKVLFDATDFASGVYFYRIQAKSENSDSKQAFLQSRKLIFLK
ncbi:T9SS type A sorting domain-containing protein [candidate division KSB1 bacterium]|nr:T9SS type A sorting domain-containing protein [candidate division KSB1 bacterium]